ncbi:MAG: helix-turn-helix domain-containing protein [Mangrovibacterium sp.]|jgi:AraC-like DNA-binding protein
MHDEIKTYELTDHTGTTTDFILKDMADLYESTGGSPDRPHRHNYYTILLVKQGKGKHIIDFKEYEFYSNSLHFIHPGQVHQLITSEKPEGWVINFSKLFLMRNNIPDQIIDDVYLFNKHSESPPLPIPEDQFDHYLDIIRQIRHYDAIEMEYKREARGALLKLLLIQSNNHCTRYKNENPQTIETGNRLVRHFKELIEKHYQEYHKVSDYAEMLAVTSDYLNKSVKTLTGKSAKEYILDRILIEAKRVLLFTELTNKELSYSLGFEEPAHFSNFFKRYSGLSPLDFRNSARQS